MFRVVLLHVLIAKFHWRAWHFELVTQLCFDQRKGIMEVIIVILGILPWLQWGCSFLRVILVVKGEITKMQGMSLLLGVFKKKHR